MEKEIETPCTPAVALRATGAVQGVNLFWDSAYISNRAKPNMDSLNTILNQQHTSSTSSNDTNDIDTTTSSISQSPCHESSKSYQAYLIVLPTTTSIASFLDCHAQNGEPATGGQAAAIIPLSLLNIVPSRGPHTQSCQPMGAGSLTTRAPASSSPISANSTCSLPLNNASINDPRKLGTSDFLFLTETSQNSQISQGLGLSAGYDMDTGILLSSGSNPQDISNVSQARSCGMAPSILDVEDFHPKTNSLYGGNEFSKPAPISTHEERSLSDILFGDGDLGDFSSPRCDLEMDSLAEGSQTPMSIRDLLDGNLSMSTLAVDTNNGRINCSTCNTNFARLSDLRRHEKKHRIPTNPCLISGCSRKGMQSFYRQDKLLDHIRKKHRLRL
jgi:hypothetical protein